MIPEILLLHYEKNGTGQAITGSCYSRTNGV